MTGENIEGKARMLDTKRALEIALFSEPEYCLDSLPGLKKTSIIPLIRRAKNEIGAMRAVESSVRETLKSFPGISLKSIQRSGQILRIEFEGLEAFAIERSL